VAAGTHLHTLVGDLSRRLGFPVRLIEARDRDHVGQLRQLDRQAVYPDPKRPTASLMALAIAAGRDCTSASRPVARTEPDIHEAAIMKLRNSGS
jgi:hypothetical protein